VCARRRLTDFLDVLTRSETTSVFMPTRSFRRLSPGNPYAEQYAFEHGDHHTVQPAMVALRLMNCRERLAESWHVQIEDLCQVGLVVPATNSDGLLRADDAQILHGAATKVAAREMLHDLSLRPSHAQVHEWLTSFLLVDHAADLTRHGSVMRLHADLAAQPIHIRGSALVDPLCIGHELRTRSAKVLEHMAHDLRDAGAHPLPKAASFLDQCFNL
jgi:hypothetical protein